METNSFLSHSLFKIKKKLIFQFLWVGLFIVIGDQASKLYSYYFLSPNFLFYPSQEIKIFNWGGISFSLTYLTNKGAAWGFLGDYQIPLLYFRGALILGLCLFLFKFNKVRSWEFPLILIIFGAFSNVLDFFIYGHVVDMLYFRFKAFDFPVFNLADSAISIGMVWLFFLSTFTSKL